MTITLTGASGFLGTNLLNALKSDYSFVTLGLNKHSNSDFSIECLKNISAAVNNKETVIHLAARAHVMNDELVDPWAEYYKSNVRLTIDLAKAAAEAGVNRFIFISSLKVNGEVTNGSLFFANDPADAHDIYAKSKALAEQELIKICEQSGMEYVIIRPPLVYGEGVKANFMALFNLVTKKLPLPFGLIKDNRRSLVSVYNLVDLIDTCISHPEAANQTFLVSDDHDLSTTEMVKLMSRVQGVKPWLMPVPVWLLKVLGKLTGKSDMLSRLTDSLQVDITHTKETLDWVPPYSVEEGFARCVRNIPDTND